MKRAEPPTREAAATTDLARVHALLCSPFVGEEEYRAALAGGRADLGTVRRYLATPLSRRPSLSAYFDAGWYRVANPDTPADADPLLHFLDRGAAGWLSPHPLIDLPHIARQDPTLLGPTPSAAALATVLDDDLADPSPYFDRAFYRSELREPARGLLRHFLTIGLARGARPNQWLDLAWYAAHHDDVAKDPYLALRDFIVRGDPTGRAAGPGFDGLQYWRRYVDVADASRAPLRHWLEHGRQEGRQAPVETAPAAPRYAVREPLAPQAIAVGAALPIDPDDAALVHAAFAGARARAARTRKDVVRKTAPKLVACANPAAAAARLRLPAAAAAPRLSILIPVFNEPENTVACLAAIVAARPAATFEIVLGDDASSDPTVRGLAAVPNLVVVRQPANVGFLRNCNAAFRRCRGEYVLLLNNDAQPLAGAIDALVGAMDADPAIGAAGPKLIYPDGRLQEAGCFLTPEGQSGMIGLFMNPDDAEFCYDRDVAYCSGAALMLRRSAVGETLFDEAYAPAYCEDVDLCLRLAASGHRVRYVSGATVAHRLGASADPRRETLRQRGIIRNQAILQARWGDRLAAMDRVRVIAFYLPQFHRTPRNDLWWGSGFTEWTNVARAQPSYVGHYQPHLPADLGFYDLRLADSLRAQAALAARYGVEGVCVYHYDFGGERLLDAPMRVLLDNPDIPLRHCLCWANENWTRRWDGGDQEILIEQRYDDATLDRVIAEAVRHATDPRSLRVDGAALFLVYRPLQLPDAARFAARCRAGFAAAGLAVHLVYVESMEVVDRGLSPAAIGFDAAVEFPPHGRAVASSEPAEVIKEGWSGYRYDYARTAAAFIERPGVAYRRYPAVFPNWDNTPRQPLLGTSFDGATPEMFAAFVEAKIDEIRRGLVGEARLLFVNAWNEWAEGAHLEPDTGHGHRWLEALRDAVDSRRWN